MFSYIDYCMEDRVSEINTEEFYRIISNVVKSYLYANNEEIIKIEDIYISLVVT